jgi:hypothetical protein
MRPTKVSSAKVSIIVGKAGIVAVLDGGRSRTEVAASGFVFNASGSHDKDYPSEMSRLHFAWDCYEYSPGYMMSCPSAITDFFTSSPIITVPAGVVQITESVVYVVSVFVSSPWSDSSDSTSIQITLAPQVIPTVALRPLTKKLSSFVKNILTGAVMLPQNLTAIASWSLNAFTQEYLNTISLTPTIASFSAPGANDFYLVIAPNTLSPGATFVFTLIAQETDGFSGIVASAQINVIMNSPPINGELITFPSKGIAFQTYFQLTTISWSDDLSDYPLSFMIYSYTLNQKDIVIVNPRGVSTSASTVLAQGLSSMGHRVTCGVQASDIHGDIGSVETFVTVLPLDVNTSRLTALVDSALSVALKSNNIEAVSFSFILFTLQA